MNGFVGEFTILMGSFSAYGTPWFTILATLGVIMAAVYLLWMFQKVYLGPLEKEENKKLLDLNAREILLLVPLVALIFWIGLYPQPFFSVMQPSVDALVKALPAVAMLH